MQFTYTVTTSDGSVQRGMLEGANSQAIYDILLRQGLSIISIKEAERAQNKIGLNFKLSFFSRIKFYEYVSFVDRLATMLRVGYALTDAIEVLQKDAVNPLFKEILTQVKYGLEKGRTLSSTLAQYPKNFSMIFLSLLKAGESSGTLEKVLDNLTTQLKKDYELRKKIKSALIYPLFLLTLTTIVMLGMFIFILPRMIKIFSQSNTELPITTKILVFISSVLSYNLVLTFFSIFIIIVSIITLVKSKSGKQILSKIGFQLPVIKNLMKQVMLARFCRTLSSLLKSGIPILEAIDLTANATGENHYGAVIRQSKKSLERGTSLSAFLTNHPNLFPNLLISMISVGEKSGELDVILEKVAAFYELEVDSSLKDFIVFLEPVMLLFIAVAIGFLALAIITPIYSLVGSVG